MAYVIGLMSGTSLDGCDAALVEFQDGEASLVAFGETPMPQALRARILQACSPQESSIDLVCSLNVELGYWFAQAAKAVCEKAGISPAQVLCVGSHGQTVWHIPQSGGDYVASTLQIGEPAVIAYELGIPVVSSFRAMDMAAGGRGAPLVPYTEFLLYKSGKNRALQNIGGIGNVTVLPGNCTLEEVIAFDTGPGNMVIDALVRHFYDKPYDANGEIAAQGAVQEELLARWMATPFIDAPPPKATGREEYGAAFVEAQLRENPRLSPEDFIATATRFTAESIARNYRLYVLPKCAVEEVVLSGGGSHNTTLMGWIAELLPACRLLRQEDLGWPSDAKEAVAFALLAYETWHGRPGNAPTATGAARQMILGNITPAPFA